MSQARARTEDPAWYRWPILAAAALALGTWWGLGLPYSLFSWQLDETQLRWVLICYAWEVPAVGLLGPVLFSQLWWREIECLWRAAFDDAAAPDARNARFARLDERLLDYPRRMA